MAQRRSRAAKKRPKPRPASRRKPAPAPQRPSIAPLPGLSPDSAVASGQWALLHPLDVKGGGTDQRGESFVLKAAPTPPVSAPPPARGKGPRAKAARDCAVAVLVRRGAKLADLIRTVGLNPSDYVMRSFLRILANGKKLLEEERSLPREAMPVASFDKSRYQGDTVALVSVVLPLLGALPGVPPLNEPKVRAQLLGLLAPRRSLT